VQSEKGGDGRTIIIHHILVFVDDKEINDTLSERHTIRGVNI